MKNRKIVECPKCGRKEQVAAERELVMCSYCAMLRADAYAKKDVNIDMNKKLQKVMETRKISARNLAYELGIAQSYLYEMINGDKPLNSKVYKWIER